MRSADDIRRYCFSICKACDRERDGIPRFWQSISEILDPFGQINWHRLLADEPHPTEPGEVSRSIRKTNEAAVQRAFFFQGKTKVGDGRIRWLDAEVPVCPGLNPRRRSLDLYGLWMSGRMPDRKKPVVVELKFASVGYPGAGSPPFALFEALAYGVSLYANRVSNGGDLWGHRLPLDVDSFPDLVVAANRTYWTSWREAVGKEAPFLFDLCRSLERVLAKEFPNRPPRALCAHFPDIDFKRQKGDATHYEPRVPARSQGWELLTSARDLERL